MKLDSTPLGVAAVIIVAAIAGDFAEITSLTEKVLAYTVVAVAPSFAMQFRRWKRDEITYSGLPLYILVTSALSLAIALPILYFWKKAI